MAKRGKRSRTQSSGGGSKSGPSRRRKPSNSDAKPSGRPGGGPGRPPARARPESVNATIEAQTAKQLAKWMTLSEELAIAPKATFELDDWQKEGIDRLISGDSIIVDAPTSAGKTIVAEEFLRQRISEPGFRMVYTTPVKSLTNDKLFEMREKFGHDNVGISTGDYKENLHAPIVVATLESYRNSQLGTDDVPPPSIVVFDEYHYLGESSRGSAWEESIILTPPETQILLLSASVSNATEFCEWIRSLKNRPCFLISTEVRPVPLENIVFNGQQWTLAGGLSPNWKRKLNPRTMRFPVGDEDIANRVVPLLEAKLTPFILYAGRRLSVETSAKAIGKTLDMLPLEKRQELEEFLQEVHEDFQSLSFLPSSLRSLIVTKGVAYHHSGLAPPAKILVEKLLKAGKLRACVATMGLSLGINFAVRSALISDYRRPDEQGFVDYSQSEVLQMLGRAGRRGNDIVGYSIWPSLESYYKMSGSKRQPCRSNFRVEPITLMGLIYRGFGVGRLESFYRDSFGAFQEKHSKMSLIRPDKLAQKLNNTDLPCRHPAIDFDEYQGKRKSSMCNDCPLKKPCHRILAPHKKSKLNQHYAHLLRIGCIDYEGDLTAYGKLARYFPQNGGLLFAQRLVSGEFNADNLQRAAEFAGSLALAGHKSPTVPESYRPLFDPPAIEKELRKMYPFRLFADLYDTGKSGEDGPVLREFNPTGGFIIKKWMSGCEWKDLENQCTHERFGAGDLMNLIYRVATYLQSIAQLHDPSISDAASALRKDILRDPMGLAIKPTN